jgi:hypothetical protein
MLRPQRFRLRVAHRRNPTERRPANITAGIVQAFADGKVGDILFTLAKIAFANAVKFLAGASSRSSSGPSQTPASATSRLRI